MVFWLCFNIGKARYEASLQKVFGNIKKLPPRKHIRDTIVIQTIEKER